MFLFFFEKVPKALSKYCHRPTLPSTNSHSPAAYPSASRIFHARIILFHSFVVFCLLFFSLSLSLGGVSGDADRKHVQRERRKAQGPHQPESERGCCSHMVYFLTTRPPGCLGIPLLEFHSVAPYKTFKLTNLRQHDCSSSSASRSGGIRSATAAAGLKSRTVGWTDGFPSEMLSSGSACWRGGGRVGIQEEELRIQSDKPQPLSVNHVLQRDIGSPRLTSEASRLAVCLSFISFLIRGRA